MIEEHFRNRAGHIGTLWDTTRRFSNVAAAAGFLGTPRGHFFATAAVVEHEGTHWDTGAAWDRRRSKGRNID